MQTQNIPQQKDTAIAATNFTTTLLVDQTPEEVFNAIRNVRGWWSEQIDGGTENLHDEFTYHFKEVHLCKMKLVEVIPNQKVVWLVLDNYFDFTEDKTEWIGTKVIFEISKKGQQTMLRFTHEGLVPAYECFNICRDAWTTYIQTSLRNLIATGKGKPNPAEGGFNQELIDRYLHQSKPVTITSGNDQDYQVSIAVKASAHEAFNSINNVSQWWTESMEGNSQKLNDEFSVRFGDIHYSKQKLVEVVPDKKVVWLITESQLNFLEDKEEWNNTKIVFEIFTENGQTTVRFTHIGINPESECYDACSGAWSAYIGGSLMSLINTGKGHPTPKSGI